MSWGKRRAIIILVVIVFFGLIIWIAVRPRHLASRSVLVIDAEGSIQEQRTPNILDALTGGQAPVLHEYLDAIDAAATDSRITGIVVRIGPLSTGWAKLEEIRAHLLAFQSSGKPSICYLGYDGVGNPEYYLATACRQIWLVPSNPVDISGMMAEATFLRGTLDKLKIVPQFFHIAEYKTASNQLTEKKFTPAHREEVQSLLTDVFNRYVAESAQARHMPPAAFESILKSGPLLTGDAVRDRIVDRLGYWDQLEDYFRERSREWNPVSLARYSTLVHLNSSGQTIAIVHASGLIASGSSENSPTGGLVMGGDSVASEIRALRDDSDVKAIILRIDSGGGSVVASEVIRREVQLARARKPVVVSMSDLAASGGYWIAAPATRIVADPDTETGSIGVLVGKLNIAGLYNLLGASTDYVATSDNATLFSDQQNFTPAQQAFIQRSLNDVYAQFTQGVAAGRHMSVAAVDKIAKGRVWTGAQAQRLGLVDDLGGIDRAIQVAKELAHIPAASGVSVVRYPREKSLFEQIFERQENPMSESRADSLAGLVHRLALDEISQPVQARMPYQLRIR
ncbi:MAG TPA: signal peptide peptidase SppA [Candidatus Acidoferrales bacterium]|nr:signal peptide peptidase SppA [Candidatus Acidoferrales bacterium]